MLLIGDILEKHSARKLLTLTPENSLADGLEMMTRYNIHHLPIIEPGSNKDGSNGNLAGIISDRDLRLNTHSPLLYEGAEPHSPRHKKVDSLEQGIKDMLETLQRHRIGEIMTKRVITLKEDDTALRAVTLMKEADISAIVIVKNENQVQDIVTRSDLMDVLLDFLKK
ncbi:CBS domain-containing protein [Acrasis kona]|uniref:CBS domain-containing protein n=1 Tax=Acrasis kona TaxID=1008807 RepID=A0AAW2Z7W0_9EUKA